MGDFWQDTLKIGLPIAGTVIGGAIGGPVGAAVGGGAGQLVAGQVGGDPYKKAEGANLSAGADLERLGNEARGMTEAGIGRALDQTTPAARQWRNTYETGELAGPGYAEKLFEERRAGTSPDQIRARQMGHKSIGDAFAASGGFNSGARMKTSADFEANLATKEAEQLANLSLGAQGAKETRLGGAFDRLSGLGMGRAGIVAGGTNAGVQSYVAGKTGGIGARLSAAQTGIDRSRDMAGAVGQTVGYGVGAALGNGAPPPPAPRPPQPPRQWNQYSPNNPDGVMYPTRF